MISKVRKLYKRYYLLSYDSVGPSKEHNIQTKKNETSLHFDGFSYCTSNILDKVMQKTFHFVTPTFSTQEEHICLKISQNANDATLFGCFLISKWLIFSFLIWFNKKCFIFLALFYSSATCFPLFIQCGWLTAAKCVEHPCTTLLTFYTFQKKLLKPHVIYVQYWNTYLMSLVGYFWGKRFNIFCNYLL